MTPVRAAVIADTHMPRGRRQLPADCRRHLEQADLILHVGDLTGRPFLEELERIGPPLRVVQGNADEQALRNVLPESLVLELEGSRIVLLHDPGPAAGREERLAARFPGCSAVIFGHTHRPQAEQRGGVWFLNPGSPTERRRSPFRSMLLLHLSGTALEPEPVRL